MRGVSHSLFMTPSEDNAQPSKDDAKLNAEDTPSPKEVPDVSFPVL
jgi:hypothetical protein